MHHDQWALNIYRLHGEGQDIDEPWRMVGKRRAEANLFPNQWQHEQKQPGKKSVNNDRNGCRYLLYNNLLTASLWGLLSLIPLGQRFIFHLLGIVLLFVPCFIFDRAYFLIYFCYHYFSLQGIVILDNFPKSLNFLKGVVPDMNTPLSSK